MAQAGRIVGRIADPQDAAPPAAHCRQPNGNPLVDHDGAVAEEDPFAEALVSDGGETVGRQLA